MRPQLNSIDGKRGPKDHVVNQINFHPVGLLMRADTDRDQDPQGPGESLEGVKTMEEPLFVINRMVVLVLPKGQLVEWINGVSRGMGKPVSLDEARERSNAFLIPASVGESVESHEEWLGRNWSILFERVLESWCADQTLWPRFLTRELFDAWCEFFPLQAVMDCSDEPLEYGGVDQNHINDEATMAQRAHRRRS
jgi:hypothetical protein